MSAQIRTSVIAQAPAGFRPSPGTPVKRGVLGEEASRRWYHVSRVEEEAPPGAERPITRDFLAAYVADFYRSTEPGVVYRGHVDLDRPQWLEEPPAAAWVLALELTDSGDLYALYELTPSLEAQIRAGEYRYNSIFGLDHHASGVTYAAEFRSIAITNRPAVEGLTPMAATRAARREDPDMTTTAAARMATDVEYFKKAMRELGPDAAQEQILKLVDAMRAMDAVKAGEGGGEAAGEGDLEFAASKGAQARSAEPVASAMTPPEPVAAAEDPMAALTAAAEAMGMTPLEFIEAAVAAMQSAAPAAEGEAAMAMARARDLEAGISQVRSELAEVHRRAEAAEGEVLARDIELARERGHVADNEANTLSELAGVPQARERVRARLEQARKTPTVNTTPRYQSHPQSRGGGLSTIHDEREQAERAMRAARPSLDEDAIKRSVDRIMDRVAKRRAG